jgi:hypothetical protein
MFSYAINKDPNLTPLIVAPDSGTYDNEVGGSVGIRRIEVIGPTNNDANVSMVSTPTYESLFNV